MREVKDLCARFHGYGSAGNTATYAWGIGEPIEAAFAWQPPPLGSAIAVCPTAPAGVLSLSRMVAIPREDRTYHLSKPLRVQMRKLIDRGRWPVLVTYSDEGQGHTGHVYKCSGWTATKRSRRPFFVNASGVRVSELRNGAKNREGLRLAGYTWIQRWEHRIVTEGSEAEHMRNAGWSREPTGRLWRSGNPAFCWVRR